MQPNAFIGETKEPTPDRLSEVLGRSAKLWGQLLARLAEDCNLVDQEWKSYSAKTGWAMRLKVKKRNILYLVPYAGSFRVTFVLGGRAVEDALRSKLSRKVREAVDAGKPYPEGTLIDLDITSARDIPGVLKLTAVKLAN